MNKKIYYASIDGLRAFAAIGIVLMHVLFNGRYEIDGFVFKKLIPSFTDLVFLFMVISGFSMCCGYWDKIINNKLSLSDFYGKRFKRILPFFCMLVIIDIIISPSIASLYEGFADLTLLFGFLPDAGSISVIGVGWFLGLVFVFYLVFPFFCVLLANKKRAWAAFMISLIYNFVCENYFDVDRKNILYSACFFLAGGLIYLYKYKISGFNKWIVLGIVLVLVVLYYINGNICLSLLVSCSLLVYAIVSRGGVLENRITKFLSSISMEIYLCHMLIFRILEKLKLTNIAGNDFWSYLITFIFTIIGAILFAMFAKKIIRFLNSKDFKKHKRRLLV